MAERCCKTCKWAKLSLTKNGRTRRDWVGRCEWPMPDIALPQTITGGNRDFMLIPPRRYITSDYGTDCLTWDPFK